ncbi:hypothetical protein [Arthrobacter globiformis]|uniref:Uncharacterized protein n=1 Tax=Arthrobacter globiformis TaxID=1665 RepID=A0A328HP30_ARTGO|nr:hypothetical protein [Arthrobacter globiformis]RAM39145.1 hypothetical protein DBZ45_00930 [Arthrobacter globiformis]
MNQQSQGQPGPARQDPAQPGQGQAPLGAGPSGRPEAHNAAPNFMKQQGVRNEAVAGPFTVRDLTVFAATLVLFIASLIPMFAVRYNLWNLGSLFFLGLGVVLPLIVAALFVARRLAPDTKVRIGSLSVDQFGSVVASFAVAFFFLSVAGAYTPSLLVGLIGSLVLLAATVLARFIPFFAGDFLDRPDAPAHIMARDSAVPVRKPKAPKEPKPAAAKPGAGSTKGAVAAGAGAGAAAAGAAVPAGPEARGPVSSGPVSSGHVSHGATAVGQTGKGAAQASTAGAVIPGATADIAGTAGAAAAGAGNGGAGTAGAAPATGMWPGANAASSAAASPETGQAAVVPSAQTVDAAAQGGTVPSAKADAAAQRTAEAEQTQLDGVTAAPAAAAGAPAAEAAATGAPAAEAPVAEGKSGAAGREAAEEAARAASATPATAVHPRVDVQQQVRSQEPIGATVDPASWPEESEHEQVHEAFWFAVAQHRTAVDERTGAPLFGIEPGGWVLALEDRGDEFLVQHTDGRVGVLRDLSNIERG